MPYVGPEEAINTSAIDIASLLQEIESAPLDSPASMPWRRALMGTETTRWVLWAMPAGYHQPAHKHPRADEVFHVLAGRAVFRFEGEVTSRTVGPGTVLLAQRGVAHEIGVPGPERLILLVSVTPNEDVIDETREVQMP